MSAPGRASRWHDGDLILEVRVQPRASHDAVRDVRDGRLQVRTTAPPADGKANKAIIRLLADYLGVAPSRITLLRGAAGRNKQLRVRGPLDPPHGL